eukprot:359735-Amphidinium_carterae.1
MMKQHANTCRICTLLIVVTSVCGYTSKGQQTLQKPRMTSIAVRPHNPLFVRKSRTMPAPFEAVR